MAREEPIAPKAMMAAATKNNEQNRRRHGNGINVQFEVVVIELPVRIGLVAVNGRRDGSLPQNNGECHRSLRRRKNTEPQICNNQRFIVYTDEEEKCKRPPESFNTG